MSQSRSREALISFLDYLGQKGLMAPATATARRIAAKKVLSILTPDEAEDVLVLDLDGVMTRFGHLQGKNFTPGSLNTYKSRVKAGIEDFAAYVDNPLTFKPNVQRRKRLERTSGGASAPLSKATSNSVKIDESPKSPAQPFDFSSGHILPVPIRADLMIKIHGLPFDLSKAEAQKIANVILALAT